MYLVCEKILDFSIRICLLLQFWLWGEGSSIVIGSYLYDSSLTTLYKDKSY